ncbi:MAG: PepSY domain-containing protein [Paludibacteraceae bacterium]|nr:PepSY domain-containing protein [Paludibacteraceae bacterium]
MQEDKIISRKKKCVISWRAWHKWVGMFFVPFILIFCVSGIILNHRQLFSSYGLSRWWMPTEYHIENWNQGSVKGTLKVDDGLIAYGQMGVWKTDPNFECWKDFNNGITPGIDNHKISNVVRTSEGILWCAGLYDAYRYNKNSSKWETLLLPNNEERISDITLRGDTVVVLSRSTIYEAVAPEYSFVECPIKKTEGFDNKVTLFKTVWMLHSGELFGICGKLIVDAMGIVLIILCITGLVFFVLSYTIKYKKRDGIDVKQQVGWMKWNLRWHNRLGAGCIILTVLLAVTGMCLRPPLMIPLALTKISPLPGSTLSDDNVFHDKLRGIRWDANMHSWLLSTSEGFFSISDDLHNSVAVKITQAPPVSPMGINVFCRNPKVESEWLVGSFSGLFSWNPITASVVDYFTGASAVVSHGRPVAAHTVTGWTKDLSTDDPVIFEYSAAPSHVLPEMPKVLKEQPMSLWNFALELHVGRCYEPFMGSVVSALFVFVSGLLLTLILISGYIIYRRR